MTHYELLKVKPSATVEEIRRAYRRSALRLHPDPNPEDKEAERKFKEISAAYTVLADSVKRHGYDIGLQRPHVAAAPRATPPAARAPRPGARVPLFRQGSAFFQGGVPNHEYIIRTNGAQMQGGEPTVVNGVPMPGFRTFRANTMRPESNTGRPA